MEPHDFKEPNPKMTNFLGTYQYIRLNGTR